MKVLAPDYYSEFKCIADKCKHNCCVGWEIDIDEATRRRYELVGGELGEKLRACITRSDGAYCFALDERGRCPFLGQDGLCRIITTLGEDWLCDICKDHPRWRNFFDSHEEIGVSLACEQACEIILSCKHKVGYVQLSCGESKPNGKYQTWLLDKRGEIIELAQDRSRKVSDRINKICALTEVQPPSPEQFLKFLYTLERFDDSWSDTLTAAEKSTAVSSIDEVQSEQLLVYFLMRHVANAADKRDFKARVAFCVASVKAIELLHAKLPQSLKEIARAYSVEVEYSEDNLFDSIYYCDNQRKKNVKTQDYPLFNC